MATLNAQPTGSPQMMDLLKRYQRLHDGLSEMVESGRLTEADIPEDYDWLVNSMLVPLANDSAQELLAQSEESATASSTSDEVGTLSGEDLVQTEMSVAELDIVLAGLRLYQMTPFHELPPGIAEIACEHSDFDPEFEDIEELCQRLNMSPDQSGTWSELIELEDMNKGNSSLGDYRCAVCGHLRCGDPYPCPAGVNAKSNFPPTIPVPHTFFGPETPPHLKMVNQVKQDARQYREQRGGAVGAGIEASLNAMLPYWREPLPETLNGDVILEDLKAFKEVVQFVITGLECPF